MAPLGQQYGNVPAAFKRPRNTETGCPPKGLSKADATPAVGREQMQLVTGSAGSDLGADGRGSIARNPQDDVINGSQHAGGAICLGGVGPAGAVDEGFGADMLDGVDHEVERDPASGRGG